MANEIQRLYFGSQESPVAYGNLEDGTFTLTHDGNTTASLNYNDAASTIQSALEGLASIGSGNIAVTLESNGYTFTFQGSLADTNVPEITASSSLKMKADSVSGNTTVNGADTANEVQRISLGGATTGSFNLNGTSVSSPDFLSISSALSTIFGSGNTNLTGSDPFDVEFISSYAATDVTEMTISNNTTDGSPSVSTITDGYAGQQQQVQIQCTDSPTEGTLSVTLGTDSNSWSCTDTSPSLTGWSLSSGSANDWTFTRSTPAANVSVSASESSPELRKSCDIVITTTQEGSGGGGGSAGNLIYQTMFSRPIGA